MVKTIDKIINRFSFGISFLGALIVFFIMFLICADVFGRILFHHPVIGTTEIAQNMTAAIVFLMLPWVTQQKKHVRSTMVLDKLSERGRLAVEAFSYLVGMGVFAGIIWGSWPKMIHATIIKDFQGEVFSFPLYPIWWILILGCAFSFYQCAVHCGVSLRQLFTGSGKAKKGGGE